MKYILHDTNTMQDQKIAELFMHFGYEGVGLFWAILERIGVEEKPVKTGVLKSQLHVGKRLEKCWSFLEEIDLISSSNGETFNVELLNYSEKYQIKKQKNVERISKWRERHLVTKNVTRSESVRNAPKVNRSKENIYIGEIVDYLNEKTGRQFRPNNKETVSHINARFEEGYTVDDFKAVIQGRVERWQYDDKMSDHLCPSTLFGPKFQKYLPAKQQVAKPETIDFDDYVKGHSRQTS